MGIAITCLLCGVRFRENQIVVKVDNSTKLNCDIAYYCNGHQPKNVESVSAKASTFQKQITCRKVEAHASKRKVCVCGSVFMTNKANRKYCSVSCASKAQKNYKKKSKK